MSDQKKNEQDQKKNDQQDQKKNSQPESSPIGPMDIVEGYVQAFDSAASKALENAFGEAKRIIDTRLVTNAFKGCMIPFIILFTYEKVRENLDAGMSQEDAIGEAMCEALGGMVGGTLGGVGGMGVGSVAGSVAGSYIGSQMIGKGAWYKYKELLQLLANLSLANQNTSSIYPKTVQSLLGQGILHTDPLVIDLSGKGIRLTDVNSSKAMFDLTGSGFANKVGWITNDEGFLVLDKNNNGKVDDISEMFGNSSTSGFQSLSAYDANKDGKIDSSDPIFKDLKVWQDTNNDGITEPGELKSLSELGIKSISLNAQRTNITQNGNQITQIASVEKEDGTTLQAADVNLTLNKLYSYYNKDVQLNPDILGLPWIKGYGFMPDLPIAMSLDTTLLNMVKDATTNTDITKLKDNFEKIIFRWAGVEDITDKELGVSWAILSGNDKQNRLLHFDNGITLSYEQVGAIEKFSGYTSNEVQDGIRHASGQDLLSAWDTMFQNLFTRFMVDSGKLSNILPAYYDFFTDTIVLDKSFNEQDFEAKIKTMLLSNDTNTSSLAILSLCALGDTGATSSQSVARVIMDTLINPDNSSSITNLVNNPFFEFLCPAVGSLRASIVADALANSDNISSITNLVNNPTFQFLFGQTDVFTGTSGNDWISVGWWNSNSNTHILSGGLGNDTLDSDTSGYNIFLGGPGDDNLYAIYASNNGNNIFLGGPGNDKDWGGSGNNFYIFERGGGLDTVCPNGSLNTVVFSKNISQNDLILAKDGPDLILSLKNNSSDFMRLKNFFGQQTYQFQFADKTIGYNDITKLWSDNLSDTLSAHYDISTGKIVLDQGFNEASFETKIAGDLLSSDANTSTLAMLTLLNLKEATGKGLTEIASTEADALANSDNISSITNLVNNPTFKFLFSEGSAFPGYSGTKESWFFSFYSVIDESNPYYSGRGNIAIGDPSVFAYSYHLGNSISLPSYFNDEDCYGCGAFNFYIFETGGGLETVHLSYGGLNTIVFNKEVSQNDLILTKDGPDLIVTFKNNASDSMKIVNFFSMIGRSCQFQFADKIIGYNDIAKLWSDNLSNILPSHYDISTGKIVLDQGFNEASFETKIAGMHLSDNAYASSLAWNTDFYLSENSDNKIVLGSPNNDYLTGGNSNDLLIGGPGNDYIRDYNGDDTLIFNKGDGQDTWDLFPHSGSVTIKFGEGISKDDLGYEEVPNGLLVKIANSTDSILLDPVMVCAAIANFSYKWTGDILTDDITMEFSDGSKLTSEDLLSKFGINGTSGDDVLYGTGNDILIGGKGNDTIYSTGLNNVFVFNPGDGKDAVIDEGNLSTFFFNTDEKNIAIFKQDDSLVVGYSTNDFVTVKNELSENNSINEKDLKIKAKDGNCITGDIIENIANALIDFNADKGVDYAQKYNELINNQQYMTLLSQSWAHEQTHYSAIVG
ncbi:Hemolysin-type calcium-binding region [Thermodesulfobium narugense DSM 14796]|uniref:Hemolysin-type calcium-binding region n=1 Tax=Thermodesulfobium narugense DSM 14796 TaxID=747365 RepID=M1E5S9_9BACT|nr:calcium-binding protein [Thermodesulfobium narugense]AEE13735.1 Hemolysin-type calcium-binding region [Thermodesulfobium narugense DSM 14796]